MAPDQLSLIKLLADVSNMWYQTGLALNVKLIFLHSLNKSSAGIINLTSVIKNWMNTQSSPVTWETVILAMEGDILNNKSKADDIHHHLSKLI